MLLGVMVVMLVQCSGPSTTVQPPEPEETVPVLRGPAFAALYFDEAGLRHRDLSAGTDVFLVEGTYLGAHGVSPEGRHLAVSVRGNDGAKLVVVDLTTGDVWEVHTVEETVEYSMAWAPDGSALAFGYYASRRGGAQAMMGPAGIQVATVEARTVQHAGCTVSRIVKHWLPGGDLVVNDGSNQYIVGADDCRTLHTVDARKMHHVAFSPDGKRMSYIFRDLVYNRETRQYEPDSTLFIADVTGENARKVVGYKYRPRHMIWSPDGTELAFDVQSQDDPALRYISIYDVEQGTSAYLNLPDAGGAYSETHPRWSPSGERMAFDRAQVGAEGSQKMVRFFMERFARVVTETSAVTWGWAGEAALILTTSEGSVSIVPIDSPMPAALSGVDTLLHVRVQER